MISYFKENKELSIILILFITLQLFSPGFQDDLWWDASVYIGMGKHMFSSGEAGLWESSRPIVWPIMLGLAWKLGLDPIITGKLLSLLFSVGILIVLYEVSIITFKRKIVALLAIVLLSSLTIYFSFSSKILTEIPSTFFFLLGLLFFLKNQYKKSGLFLGIALITRFFQVFSIIPIIIILFWNCFKKKNAKQIAEFLALLSFPVLIYLTLNTILYSNPLYPIELQAYMTVNTGEIYSQGVMFYFVELMKQNFLYIFAIIGFLALFKEKNQTAKNLLIILIIGTLPYLLTDHKELRLLIPMLPLLMLFTAKGISYFVNNVKQFKTSIILAASGISLMLLIITIPIKPYNDNLDFFHSFVQEQQPTSVWASSPLYVSQSDTKAEELIYYPRYTSEKIDYFSNNLHKTKTILINSCDLLPCQEKDKQCLSKHYEFISKIKDQFNTVISDQTEECEYYIFLKD